MISYESIKKIFFKLDPEQAHAIAEYGLRLGAKVAPLRSFIEQKTATLDPRLSQRLLNRQYQNPVMIAGGFDKNATMLRGLAMLGFGAIEYGTFTLRPQSGNAKPRLFRLIDEQSIQNAMGFNNDGARAIMNRLLGQVPFCVPLWANIGKNKLTPNQDALEEYVILASSFEPFCDTFVINLSSPNTPGLRELLNQSFISELFDRLNFVKKPILLKISSDLTPEYACKLCEHAIKMGASGVIVANTSTDYSISRSKNLQSFGGLSGQVLAPKAKALLKEVATALKNSPATIVASGGIADANEAYERIRLGASLVQVFTGFIYKGPMIAKQINQNLSALLKLDGFTNIAQAVGVDLRD